MRGVQGLGIAIVLGLAGAAANFYYLNTEAQKKDIVAFIGIKKGVILARGDKLTEDKLEKVEIPANHVGNLKDFAYLWDIRKTVIDMPVWRTLDSNSEGALLLMQSDVKTPPKELTLAKGEVAAGIPVPKNFVTAHVNPGDKVSFKFLLPAGPTPAGQTPAGKPPASPAAAVSGTGDLQPKAENSDLQPKPETSDILFQPPGTSEIIGPFVVVSIGNRLESVELMKASKIAPVQENVLMIRVSKNEPGEEERFDKLWSRIHTSASNSYDILLHGK